MRISFTGTRRGMSAYQERQFEDLIRFYFGRGLMNLFTHGACVGADVQAHRIVRRIFGTSVMIGAFPSNHETSRIEELRDDCNFVAAEKPPLERDRDVVDAGKDLLIAAPLQMLEARRSGTWTTVRYARRIGVKVEVMMRERA